MNSERSWQRHIDALEFVSLWGASGGEQRAVLEAFLFHSRGWFSKDPSDLQDRLCRERSGE